MKRYYIFDFPLEMYGIGICFAALLLWIAFGYKPSSHPEIRE